eukprot:TRINITY_DN16226_c0_g1_i1.p1 TRINITY_DN16226_c0_g1~~TRINITY_DN16226_c0_g1_i1.p1  ORF type:complete len:918 (+),score=126.64 TRINITY_DN16226_c0_g1_i1:81-2756(+)
MVLVRRVSQACLFSKILVTMVVFTAEAAVPSPIAGNAPLWSCATDEQLGPLVGTTGKGLAVDDTTWRWCSQELPGVWPNTNAPVKALRLFKAWDSSWQDDRQAAWANLKNYVDTNGAKVLMGTPLSCVEEDDLEMWQWTKQLMQLLGPDAILGLAIGNELELLFTKVSFEDTVTPECVARLWEGGRLWERFTTKVAELDSLDGGAFSSVQVTSVFGGLALAGNKTVPFLETPGKALVNSFFLNVTQRYGQRYAFTWTVYPYFDPNEKLDVGTTDQCTDSLARSLCFATTCDAPKSMNWIRTKMERLPGVSSSTTLWIGETGWSSSGAPNSDMKNCPAWSSNESLKEYYKNFLAWDLNLPSKAPPDQVFYFTVRNALNFGYSEHFGLVDQCFMSQCKIHSAGYQPPTTTLTTTSTTTTTMTTVTVTTTTVTTMTTGPCGGAAGCQWVVGTWEDKCSSSCGAGKRKRSVVCSSGFDGDCIGEKPSSEDDCRGTVSCSWVSESWGLCDKTCGEGLRSRIVRCSSGQDIDCVSAGLKPKEVETCKNVSGCVWNTSAWSSCSTQCGVGLQSREVRCPSGVAQDCTSASTVPVATRSCSASSGCSWKVTAWSECSTTCGTGLLKRKVYCSSGKDGDCQGSKPVASQACNETVGCSWNVSAWSACNVTCGVGYQERTASCTSSDTSLCSTAPAKLQKCYASSGCSWILGNWSTCSSKCGAGSRSRSVKCQSGVDADCPGEAPSNAEACYSKEICVYKFYDWSSCSTTCGEGFRLRQVLCPSGIDSDCGNSRLLTTERCLNTTACTWLAGEWSVCSNDCGTGVQKRDVTCSSGRAFDCTQSPLASTRSCTRNDGCAWRVLTTTTTGCPAFMCSRASALNLHSAVTAAAFLVSYMISQMV